MKSAPSSRGFFGTELGLRILSAVVLILVILAASWTGGFLFALICAILSALLYYEWQRIVRVTPFDMTEALLSAGFGFLVLMCLVGSPLFGLVVMVAIGAIMEMTSSGAETRDVRWIGLGALYCAIPVFALPVVREEGGFPLLLLLFLVVWTTDIAAYFAGRFFGGPKLAAAISPNKTWSGAAGGLIAAALVAWLFAWVTGSFNPGAALFLAVLLSVTSQAGDLFESWVKRHFGVKDSSKLIPGHGGFLDRVDGLIAAALPVAIIILLSKP